MTLKETTAKEEIEGQYEMVEISSEAEIVSVEESKIKPTTEEDVAFIKPLFSDFNILEKQIFTLIELLKETAEDIFKDISDEEHAEILKSLFTEFIGRCRTKNNLGNIYTYMKSIISNEDYSNYLKEIERNKKAASNRAKALAEKEEAERRFKERLDEEVDLSKGTPAYLTIMEEEGCTQEEALKILEKRMAWVKE